PDALRFFGVAHEMALETAGFDLDQRRPLAAPRACDRRARGRMDRVGIVAGDEMPRHRIGSRAIRIALDRGAIALRHRNPVAIVLDHEDGGHLPYRSEVERLV